jgi:hypothetical protein
LTQAQIKQYKKALEKDIIALENYKQEQYGEKIIQTKTARITDTTTGETRGRVSREKGTIEKTSLDEPIKGKTKKHREAKVKKAVEEAYKTDAIVTTETEEELFPKVYTVETINADIEKIIDNFEPKDNFKKPIESWGVYNEDADGNSISEIYVTIKGNNYTKEELLEIEDPENPAVQETLNEIDRLQKLLDAELAALQAESKTKVKTKELTINEINADINLESLQQAKAQKLEVEYLGKRYKIKRVGKKSVTLSAPHKEDVNIKEPELAKALIVVEPGVKKATAEENKQVEENEKLVEKTERVYEELPEDKAALDKAINKRKDDFLNNLCI